jgi:hypothetical protein
MIVRRPIAPLSARKEVGAARILVGIVSAVSAVALVWGAGVGCGSSNDAPAAAPKDKSSTHSEAIQHEACSESGHRVEALDANGDGKPDIKRIFDKSTGKELCRISDLNHDGKVDLYEYFDANGNIRRREADYDDNGVVDAIEYYENGKLVRREYDTTGQHRIDTWDFFDPATGKRVRRERDTTNDGRVDQWWTWAGDKVTITMDKNGDGQPDPAETLVMGGDAGPPAPLAPVAPALSDAGPPKAQTPTVQYPTEPSPFGDAGPTTLGDAGPRRKERR